MRRPRTASVEHAQRRTELERGAAEARRAERAARKERAERAARQYFAARAAEADRRTRELEDRVAELGTILDRGLRRAPRVDLAGLRAEFTPPAPDLGSVGWPAVPPDWSRYAPPRPSAVDRLAGGARGRRRLAEARAAYEAAMAGYQRAEAERTQRLDEARRRYATRLAEERRRVEEHNRRVDAFAAALRRREPAAVSRYLRLVLDAVPLPDGFPRRAEVAWPDVRVELPGPEVVPAARAVSWSRPTDELRELPRPAAEAEALYRSVLAQVVLLSLRDLFAADPALDAVTFTGQVRDRQVVRVRAARAGVEAVLRRCLAPEAALAALSTVDTGGRLPWAS